MIVSTPHQGRAIPHQKVGRWLTDSRILKYEAILLERHELVLTTDSCLNPAELLTRDETRGLVEHHCIDLIDDQTKVQPDLKETPFSTGFQLSVDGSSQCWKGKDTMGTLL